MYTVQTYRTCQQQQIIDRAQGIVSQNRHTSVKYKLNDIPLKCVLNLIHMFQWIVQCRQACTYDCFMKRWSGSELKAN